MAISKDRLDQLKSIDDTGEISAQGVPEIPIAALRRALLCFISTGKGTIEAVARSIVYHKAESGKDKLDVWRIERLLRPVRVSRIKNKLKGAQAWRARPPLEHGGYVSKSAFEAIMRALSEADPAAFKLASGMVTSQAPPPDPTPTQAKINWACQRDAVVTALEIAGIPKRLLKVPAQLTNAGASPSSIFDSDADVMMTEDLLILRDLDLPDPEWSFVKRQRYPAKTYVNGDTKLTVILANKEKLETMLGVDLIYVNETLGSIVFVQYKMLSGRDGEGGYRPDTQLEKEIERMDATMAELGKAAADESCDGYRLGGDPFFLKFCRKLLTHDDESHVPGMVVPLSFWERLMKTPAARGKRGGKVVYPTTIGRRCLTQTHFIDLVARGWVGTSTVQTKPVASYLQAVMRGKKCVVLAIEGRAGGEPDPGGEPPVHLRTPPAPRYPGQRRKIIQL